MYTLPIAPSNHLRREFSPLYDVNGNDEFAILEGFKRRFGSLRVQNGRRLVRLGIGNPAVLIRGRNGSFSTPGTSRN